MDSLIAKLGQEKAPIPHKIASLVIDKQSISDQRETDV